MNILRKSIVAGIAVLSMGTAAIAAHAEETPRHPPYAATKFDPAKRAERIELRQQKLHDALKLNANQEAAWKTYIAAIQPKQPAVRGQRASFKELPAPQRMEKWIELSKERLQRQESRLAALKTFYATLSPEQQKTFDEQTAGGRGHRGHHRRG